VKSWQIVGRIYFAGYVNLRRHSPTAHRWLSPPTIRVLPQVLVLKKKIQKKRKKEEPAGQEPQNKIAIQKEKI